eukprot:6174564-Pleurochrysis_carterae.AAC.1
MEPGRGLLAHPILVHDDITLVRDVDAVQKLADILVLHVADVLDQGAATSRTLPQKMERRQNTLYVRLSSIVRMGGEGAARWLACKSKRSSAHQ